MLTKRTDLALEARELSREGLREAEELPGVVVNAYEQAGVQVTELKITDEAGARALSRPCGRYITLELGRRTHRTDADFGSIVELIAEKLAELMTLRGDDRVLVVGLGNEDITPDAVGPLAADGTLVTAHLVDSEPELFGGFRRVYVMRAGVLGTTGLESAAMVKAVCERVHPDLVVCVDALAARSPARLCRTIQLTDTGVTPGSGVGNARQELSRATVGVPVICVGVPTVVDAATLAADLTGCDVREDDAAAGMIVTPREIDTQLTELTRLVSYGLNCALHPGLRPEDVDMLLG